MKRISILKIFSVLVITALLAVSCTKENPDVKLDPKLSTSQVFDVTSDSATVVGFVVAGSDGFTERGVCYNTAANPTIDNNKIAFTGDTKNAAYTITLSGLSFFTTYYVRAYAVNAGGVMYGEEFNFTTLPVLPFITTSAITNIQSTSANGGGNITSDGGSAITARGICFGLNPEPTLADNVIADTAGVGEFFSSFTSLSASTKYYVRAYATNSVGTTYGQQVEFTTLAPVVPVVSTSAVTNITGLSAVSGGNVTNNGGVEVTARGVCFGILSNPTINDDTTKNGAGLGEFQSPMTGLQGLTTYYVRAYATNSVGTAYGEEFSFTTLIPIRVWYVPGNYVAASYPGTTYADWSPENSPQVKSLETAPDQLEGYVYMANGTNEWKFATQPNWDGPNYGDGGAGILDPNGGNMNSPAGYYKLNADAATLTYTAVATQWGVIGSATPSGWDDETALSYEPESRTWKGAIHLTAAEFKFRANHNWDYNYGSTAANGTLDAGGSNIPVSLEDDYFFTLDLSNPFAYTYSANRWGLIGSATPGGWDSDQNMSWDAINNAMTITVDLIAGEFKFRANDDWAVNLGGTTDNLEYGGPNIAVTEAGNYTIKLYLNGTIPTYSIVKN
ncbi:MAG: SusF/SusE family outer membrane protein [Bacteroidales bacterium]|nr:SusF/SusE family outer membrane protein [Bacteroidales bacterium]